MSQSSYFRPVNNDRMAALTAFRHPVQENRPRIQSGQSALTTGDEAVLAAPAPVAGMAAPALHSVPPRPTQLNDTQAEAALDEVQQRADSMMQAHGHLDADRVARLLGLLD